MNQQCKIILRSSIPKPDSNATSSTMLIQACSPCTNHIFARRGWIDFLFSRDLCECCKSCKSIPFRTIRSWDSLCNSQVGERLYRRIEDSSLLRSKRSKYAKSESLRPGLANSAGPSASSCDWQPLATASFLSEGSSQLGKDGYNTSPPLPGIMSHLEIDNKIEHVS